MNNYSPVNSLILGYFIRLMERSNTGINIRGQRFNITDKSISVATKAFLRITLNLSQVNSNA